MALRADGTVVAWGDNSYGETNVPPWATNIVGIAAGSEHSLAVPGGGTRLHAQLMQPRLIPSVFDPSERWFTLNVPSRSGQVLMLEYKDSITQPNWTPTPMLWSGRAGSTTIYDYNATAGSSRVYRVRQW